MALEDRDDAADCTPLRVKETPGGLSQDNDDARVLLGAFREAAGRAMRRSALARPAPGSRAGGAAGDGGVPGVRAGSQAMLARAQAACHRMRALPVAGHPAVLIVDGPFMRR